MTYIAEYGIYCNCHILGTEQVNIEADSEEEAEAKAQKVANQFEGLYASLEQQVSPEENSDWYVSIEELYQA